ncbi:hypothetical protein KR222_008893, partial [Zaprionus bogoriensis]
GLVNLGSTCYFNSVLQVLSMTNEFCRPFLLIKTNSSMLCEMQRLIALLHHSQRSEVDPTYIVFASYPNYFISDKQQDSSEFLGHLLNMLNDQEVTYTCQQDPHQPMIDDFTIAPPAVQRAPCATVDELVSITDKTFGGKVSTIYTCLTCSWRSRNENTFRELQLSFPEQNAGDNTYSVQNLIDLYCAPESLDGENKYACWRCQKLQDAERCIRMTEAPRNIILTLKHFNFDRLEQRRNKLMHKVFHNDKISIKLFSHETLEELCVVQYSLYAIVVHQGFTLDSGHFFTLARDHLNNWYKFDDNVVTYSFAQEVHSLESPNTPYILFYQTIGLTSDLVMENPLPYIISELDVTPLSFAELPRDLREYINQDNLVYAAEKRAQ